MTKSQYEILNEELKDVLSKIPSKEIQQLLPQIKLFLSESAFFANPAEVGDLDERSPDEILKSQLFPLDDDAGLAKWNAILAMYMTETIANKPQENDFRVNLTLHVINISKAYSEKAALKKKRLEAHIKHHRSREGTESNSKRYEPLNTFKKAAYERCRPAVVELHERRSRERKKSSATRITYKNVAKIIYPQIQHLNRDKDGHRIMGRNGDPVSSLARILQEAASKGHIGPLRTL